jgi:serine/threonine protein kinase
MTTQTCPSPERWKEHLRGTLPAAEGEELAAHLDACSACQRLLETLTTSGDSLLDAARAVGQEPATHETAIKEALGALRGTDGGATQGWTPGAAAAEFAFLDPPAAPGELGRLGHYIVQEVVGRGGMGVVFKALDTRLNRVVAIKVLGAQYAANANARQRFEREAKAAAAVSHDHIVPIYHVDEHGGVAYLVMPLIVGKSLQDRLTESGPLELKEILRIGSQVACGLAAAHKQGLVHRDIKPANILLENGVERVKITDFGLARAVDDASLSQSGVVAGTPMYMSPEQASGTAVDHRSDLFSLGSVLYAMATGNPPFRASGTMGVLKRVCEETPPPMRDENPNVPDWFEAIVAKLHAKRPADRFQSAQEVADLLGQHLAHLQSPQSVPRPAPVPLPPTPMPSRRSSGLVVVLVIGAVACAGLCALSPVILMGLGAFFFLATPRVAQHDDAIARQRGAGEPMAADLIPPDAQAGKTQRFDWGDAIDPRGDCRFFDEPGRFTIHVPAGNHDFFPGQDRNFDAPRLLREVDGDFTAFVKVHPFDLTGKALAGVEMSPYQGAGLVVWHDSRHFLRVLITRAPAVGGNNPCMQCYFLAGDKGQERFTGLEPDERFLNLERLDNVFTIRWSADGKTWSKPIELPDVEFPRRVQVGLLAVNISTQWISPQFGEYTVDLLPGKGHPDKGAKKK